MWTPFFQVKLKRNEAFQKVTGFWLKFGLILAYGWALIVEEHFTHVKTPMNLERSCFGKNFKRVFEGFHGHNTQMVSRVVLMFSPGKQHCFLLKQDFIDADFFLVTSHKPSWRLCKSSVRMLSSSLFS